MITPTLFSGLLTLSGPQVNALDELAQAVPELFAMPVQDLRSICTSLKRIEQAQVELEEAASPKVTVQTRVPKAKASTSQLQEELHKRALEVAKSDPTVSPPPEGWAVNTCSCGRKFTVPMANRLPSMCWECLSQAGRNLRTKNIRAYMLNLSR